MHIKAPEVLHTHHLDAVWAAGQGGAARPRHSDNETDSRGWRPACSTSSPALISRHTPATHRTDRLHLLRILQPENQTKRRG